MARFCARRSQPIASRSQRMAIPHSGTVTRSEFVNRNQHNIYICHSSPRANSWNCEPVTSSSTPRPSLSRARDRPDGEWPARDRAAMRKTCLGHCPQPSASHEAPLGFLVRVFSEEEMVITRPTWDSWRGSPFSPGPVPRGTCAPVPPGMRDQHSPLQEPQKTETEPGARHRAVGSGPGVLVPIVVQHGRATVHQAGLATRLTVRSSASQSSDAEGAVRHVKQYERLLGAARTACSSPTSDA